ncbi:MAG: 4-hydroxy-tetrahydrodipicolinate synthase [Actinomycetota bacterium]
MTGRFGSVITAMVTPFRDDRAVDLDRAQELARWLIANGSDAVAVAGSTGEAPTLSAAEKADLFQAVGEAVRGQGKVLAGVGTYATAETLELAHAAADAGADGLLVVTPYYNKPPQRGLTAHFSAVADATDLPVVLYNIPGRTALRIEHDTLLELAAHPNIVAVKDSTGDCQAVSRLIAEAPDGFEVYSGDDWATFGYLCLGAVGVVSVASHLVGTQIHQMVDLIVTGDIPAARKIHEQLTPLYNAMFITSNPIPVKAALQMLGRGCGGTRLPLVAATSDEEARVRAALEDAGLLA